MFAFFHNLPENGKDGSAAPKPSMDVYTGGTKVEHEQLKADVTQLSEFNAKYVDQNTGRFQEWLKTEREAVNGQGQDSVSAEPVLQLAFDFPEEKTFPNLASESRSLATIQGRAGFVSSVENGKFGRAVSFRMLGIFALASLRIRAFLPVSNLAGHSL